MTTFSTASDPFGSLLRQFRKRQRCTQRQLAAALSIHRNTIGRWEEGSYLPQSKTLILEVARYLRLTESETRQLLEASLLSPIPLWSVPSPRNPWFTGREEVLATLHAHLRLGEPLAFAQSYCIHGLGGIGKTQLALEYAYRYALEYVAVFWIEAETLEQIHASFLRIAQLLELPALREADQPQVIAAVQRWLEVRGGWLLIWDNVEDLELLRIFLPALRRGTLLFTTQQQALGTLAQAIELQPLEEPDALLLLLRRAKFLDVTASWEQMQEWRQRMPEEYVAAQEVVRRLAGLPLALDQAGAYIEATRCRYTEYLALFEQEPLRLLQERGVPAEHPASVATMFTQAFEQMQQAYPAAAALLTACCFLAPEEIPEHLFSQQAQLFAPPLQQVLSEPFAFQETLKRLLGYGLIQRHAHRQTLVVHRLVQEVLRARMDQQEQVKWKMRMIRILHAAFPEASHEVWEECERLLPHALVCAARLSDQEADQQILAEIVSKTANYLRQKAYYGRIELLQAQALSLLEEASEAKHLSPSLRLQNLLLLYHQQEKYKQS